VEIGEDEDNESEGEKSGDENAAGNGNNKTRKRQRLRDGECWWWWCRKSFVVKGFVVAVVEALIADVCNELHEQEQLSDRFDKVEINGETPGEKKM